MSEYMEQHSVARLIGAPPGYVGHEEGGQLTEAVRRRPYSVVLFDEVEKAHQSVFNTLLQMLDDGKVDRWSRSHGKTTMVNAREMVMQEVRRHFKPELGVALGVTEAALDVILNESYDPVYGARPIRRWLERRVVTELSKMLIREEIDENSTVYIDAGMDGEELSYRVERNGGLVNAATGQKSDILIEVPTAMADSR
ncbi:putative ClpA/B family, P-loop containing nucleoside triphosphate hydrolase [Helianthus annuus]|nr:putative ClpA/B family, P-loop containing nucleoside triphosphate hydrolase [Helianthus annuus]